VSVAESTHSGLSVRTIVREHENWFDTPRPARALIAEHIAEQRDWFAAIWRSIQEGKPVAVRAAYADWFFPVFWEGTDGEWHRSPDAEDLADLARRSDRDRIALDDRPTDARVVVSIDGGGIFARRRVRPRKRRPAPVGGSAKKMRAAGDWEVIRDRRELQAAFGRTWPGLFEHASLLLPEPPASTPSRSRDLAPRTLAMAFAYYGIRDVLGWRSAARAVLSWLERYDARPPDRRDLIPACRLAARALGGEQLAAKEWSTLARAEDDVRRVCERARPRLGRFEP
jgi:hypothetical protein